MLQVSKRLGKKALSRAERTLGRRVGRVLRGCGVAMLAIGVLFVACGCGIHPSSAYGVRFVTFTSTTSYEDALRLVTDVGLQLTGECDSVTAVSTSGTPVVFWASWHPQSQRQNYVDNVANSVSPFLITLTTPLAPSDWSDRLLKMPSVQSVKEMQGSFVCGSSGYSQTPPAGDVNDLLRPDQTGTYAQITFDQSPIPSYGDALDDVLNLGLRLANPCYEKALAAGKASAWHAMGQEDAYASGHVLLVATTRETGNLWQQQVRAIPASVQVVADATSAC